MISPPFLTINSPTLFNVVDKPCSATFVNPTTSSISSAILASAATSSAFLAMTITLSQFFSVEEKVYLL